MEGNRKENERKQKNMEEKPEEMGGNWKEITVKKGNERNMKKMRGNKENKRKMKDTDSKIASFSLFHASAARPGTRSGGW